MNKNIKVTYTPRGPITAGIKGPFLVTKLMMLELLSARELVWRLFFRDFKSKFGGNEFHYGRYIKINRPLLYRIGRIGLKILQIFK